MNSQKWKAILLICLSVLFCVGCALFAAGCADEGGKEVKITGRPEGDTLELTDSSNTYTLGCEVSDVLWTSSDTAVATVDGGKLTLIAGGSTVISASKDEASDSFVLYVVDKRTDGATVTIGGKPQGDSVQLTAGSVQLTATCSDGSAVAWLSRDPAVATVDEDGTVTLLSRGTAQIVAYKASNVNVCEVYLLRVVGEAVTAISVTGLPASGNIGIGKTLPLTAAGTPADCEPFETEWKITAGGDYATIDADGNITGVKEGKATVTATVKGTQITASAEVTVLNIRENHEDFANAVIIGNYVVGSIECNDVNGTILRGWIKDYGGSLLLEQTSAPAAGALPNYFDMTFTGLEVGKAYTFSYKMQVAKNDKYYHFNQVNAYVDAQGRFTGSAETGTESQWGGSANFTANGGEYGDVDTTEKRFDLNTFAGVFIAGEETVTLRLVCNNVYKLTLDDIFVEPAPEADDFTIASTLSGSRIAVGDKAQFTASVPTGYAPVNVEWSVKGEAATIAADGTLTAGKTGEATVTATAELGGKTIEKTYALTVIEPVASALYEDFEQGYLNGYAWHGAWEMVSYAQTISFKTQQDPAQDGGNGTVLYAGCTLSSGYNDMTFTVTGLTPGKEYVFAFDLYLLSGRFDGQVNVYKDGQGRFGTANDGTLTQWGGGNLTINGGKYTTNYPKQQWNTFAGTFVAAGESATFVLAEGHFAYEILLDNLAIRTPGLAEQIVINAPDTIAIDDEVQLTVTPYPANSSAGNVVWSIAEGAAATIGKDGLLTGVSAGEVTVRAQIEGTNIYDTFVVTVIEPVAPGLEEDFEEGYLSGSSGGTWHGAWTMTAVSAISLEMLEEDGNTRLKVICPTTGDNPLTWTVTGLTIGQKYILSYDMQVLEGHHFSQINVYKDAEGRFMSGAETGTIDQWGGNNLTINGNAYTDEFVLGDGRFNNNTYAGTFVAGSETVVFLFVCGEPAYEIALDNLSVSEPSAVEDITIDVESGAQLEVGKTLTLTATGSPAGCLPFEVEWSITDGGSHATLEGNVLTGKDVGTVTVTATVKGTQISKSVEIEIISPVQPGLAEDFEEGYIANGAWHGAWEIEATTAASLAQVEDEDVSGNHLLKVTANKGNVLTMTVTNLVPGNEYLFSYKIRIENNANYHHFNQVNAYREEGLGSFEGNVFYNEPQGGAIGYTQWGPNMLFVDGVPYSQYPDTTEARFSWHTVTGVFVAGEETVVFMLCGSGDHDCVFYLDDVSVSEAPAVESIAITDNGGETLSNGTELALNSSVTLGTAATPLNHGSYEVEWAITAGEEFATLEGNVLTGKNIGEVTVTATVKGSDPAVAASVTIRIVSAVEPGFEEEFEEGTLVGGTWHGAWTLTADSAISLAMLEEEGNTRLKATCTTTGYNLLTWTVTNLKVGEEYLLSFDMEVLNEGFHFCQINVYKDGQGRFMGSAETGTIDQWGGKNLTINGSAYTDEFVLGEGRKDNNTYAGTFVAGSETVVFLFVCEYQPYEIALDNISVSEPPAVESISIAVEDGAELAANSTLALTATAAPLNHGSFEVEWEITAGEEFATLDGNVLTGVAEGEVTVTATVKGSDPAITDTVTIVITEPAKAVSEDFEDGAIVDDTFTGDGWTVTSGANVNSFTIDETNGRRLKVEASKGNNITWSVTGLKVGQEYTLSYNLQLVDGGSTEHHHFNQINVFVDGEGRYAETGTETQWGGSALTVDGTTPYDSYASTGAPRFENHTFTANFVAGSETVVFKFCGSGDHACIYYLDNLSVTPVTA